MQPTTPVLPSPTRSGPAPLSHTSCPLTRGSPHTSLLLILTCSMFNHPALVHFLPGSLSLLFEWLAPMYHSASMSLPPKAALWPLQWKVFQEITSPHLSSLHSTCHLPDESVYLLIVCLPPLRCQIHTGRTFSVLFTPVAQCLEQCLASGSQIRHMD